MRKIVTAIFAAAALAGLAACESTVEQPQYADLTFSHLGLLHMDVAEVRIVEAYQPTAAAPHVELEFPVSPLKTAARWVEDRLQATGESGILTVTITDASVIETALEKEDGITGAFTTDQAERYDGTITMMLEAEDPSGRTASTTGTIKRSVTVPEDATLNERSDIWYELTEKMMADLNRQVSEGITKHMAAFTR